MVNVCQEEALILKLYLITIALKMLRKCKELDYPRLGKVMTLVLSIIEAMVYGYLGLINLSNLLSLSLSIYLSLTSILTIILTAISMSVWFYHSYSVVYSVIGVLALLSRLISIILLHKLYNSPSE